jgi:hypothetical protein
MSEPHREQWAADVRATIPDTSTEPRQAPDVRSMKQAADEPSLADQRASGVVVPEVPDGSVDATGLKFLAEDRSEGCGLLRRDGTRAVHVAEHPGGRCLWICHITRRGMLASAFAAS